MLLCLQVTVLQIFICLLYLIKQWMCSILYSLTYYVINTCWPLLENREKNSTEWGNSSVFIILFATLPAFFAYKSRLTIGIKFVLWIILKLVTFLATIDEMFFCMHFYFSVRNIKGTKTKQHISFLSILSFLFPYIGAPAASLGFPHKLRPFISTWNTTTSGDNDHHHGSIYTVVVGNAKV